MAAEQRTRAPHTRVERTTRLVEHEFDGETYLVEIHDQAVVPDPPTDWDLAGTRGVTTIAAAVSAVALGWSTYSIGSLLAETAHPAIAFPAATVFTLTWASCLVLEWLARHDPDQAAAPRTAGWIALAIAMAAVGTHGWLAGSPAAGIIGAGIDLAAKGLWWLVLRRAVLPMDDLTRQCVRQKIARANGRLATLPPLRQVARAEAAYAAGLAALGLPAEPPANTTNQRPEQANTRADGTIRAAVNAARDLMPDATDADIAGIGIDATPDAVRAVPNTANTKSAKVVRLSPNSEQSIAGIVRTCVRDGVRELDDVLAAVRAVHPNTTRDVVRITLARAIRAAG